MSDIEAEEAMGMNRWIWTCALVFLCAPLAGCNKQANDQDAIRATIEKRLNGRADLNMSAMDREVKQVSVTGDHATAQVEFRLKGGDARMEIEYTLERQGKDWAVLGSQPMGGGMGQAPHKSLDAGGNSSPQGHPPTN
jgi:hypothetical protein